MKRGRAFRDPQDEFRKPWVGAQRFNGVIVPGKLGFRQRGMDLVVADLVQEHGRPAFAAAEFRDKVVQALSRLGRDGPVAERADGIVHGGKSGVNGATDKCDALVIGAGPAGLAAAERLAGRGVRVLVAEAMPSVGRKFLMAGKSGLNLTKSEATEDFLARYSDGSEALAEAVRAFGPDEVRRWAEGLGQPVFTGSTGRVFPESMKASPLLRAWLARLTGLGVTFETRMRWTGRDGADWLFETPAGERRLRSRVTVLALGGSSWRRLGSDGAWAGLLGVPVAPFKPSNVGLRVDWSEHMTPYLGRPVKAVRLMAGDVDSRGEWVISAAGLEGGGVYEVSMAVRDGAPLFVDLLPDLDVAEVQRRLSRPRGKASLANHLRKALGLTAEQRALLMEWGRPLPEGGALARLIKALPVPVTGTMPLDQAISTGGGVAWEALDGLMLKAFPGVFAAGEMLDWEAPTGGYLLTACLATGRAAGDAAADWLEAHAD